MESSFLHSFALFIILHEWSSASSLFFHKKIDNNFPPMTNYIAMSGKNQ